MQRTDAALQPLHLLRPCTTNLDWRLVDHSHQLPLHHQPLRRRDSLLNRLAPWPEPVQVQLPLGIAVRRQRLLEDFERGGRALVARLIAPSVHALEPKGTSADRLDDMTSRPRRRDDRVVPLRLAVDTVQLPL